MYLNQVHRPIYPYPPPTAFSKRQPTRLPHYSLISARLFFKFLVVAVHIWWKNLVVWFSFAVFAHIVVHWMFPGTYPRVEFILSMLGSNASCSLSPVLFMLNGIPVRAHLWFCCSATSRVYSRDMLNPLGFLLPDDCSLFFTPS